MWQDDLTVFGATPDTERAIHLAASQEKAYSGFDDWRILVFPDPANSGLKASIVVPGRPVPEFTFISNTPEDVKVQVRHTGRQTA